MNMIDKVAAALCRHDGDEWSTYPADGKEHFRAYARAAIKAMRKPTKGMLKAGADATTYVMDDDTMEIWTSMIDGIFKEVKNAVLERSNAAKLRAMTKKIRMMTPDDMHDLSAKLHADIAREEAKYSAYAGSLYGDDRYDHDEAYAEEKRAYAKMRKKTDPMRAYVELLLKAMEG